MTAEAITEAITLRLNSQTLAWLDDIITRHNEYWQRRFPETHIPMTREQYLEIYIAGWVCDECERETQ